MAGNWSTYRELLLPALSGRRRAVETELRQAIRDGRLTTGTRLPSSRDLAEQLDVSRGTVTAAYAQLVGEGYLSAKRGSGTTVTAAGGWPSASGPLPDPAPRWRYDLHPRVPALSAFPRAEWIAAYRAGLAGLGDEELGYPPPAGYPALRAELSDYLGRVRAVVSEPDAVVFTNGSAQGLALFARTLVGEGHRSIAVERPGHPGVSEMLRSHGLSVVPVPVDDLGIRVDLLAATDCRAVHVTAAHQFPLGVVLHPSRRHALIEWARDVDGMVIEDDYDAEHRYDRPAVGAMQALDPSRVVYQGSASKVLTPGLRLGWMVAPEPLREKMIRRKRFEDMGSDILHQAAFAHLLRTGGYDRHLRRTRALYRKRRDALLAALAVERPTWEPVGVAAGLHVVVRLPLGTDDLAVQQRAAHRGVNVMALAHYSQTPMWPGLVLGYASLSPDRLREAVRELG
jgi:GntR family transcriptional regulator / MocR family aminotransferase